MAKNFQSAPNVLVSVGQCTKNGRKILEHNKNDNKTTTSSEKWIVENCMFNDLKKL